MAGPTPTPIFPQTPQCEVGKLLTTAATVAKAYDGTNAAGTAKVLLGTMGANGGKVDSIRIKFGSVAGSAPSGTTNATVVRIFFNNGSDDTVATNNTLFTDIAIPAITYSNTAANGEFDIPIQRSLPAGWKVYAVNSTVIGGTNAALALTMLWGDY